MTTTHHFHVRSDHVGVTRRPAPFIAAGVVAAACAVVAISTIGSFGEPAVVDLDERAVADALNPIEPVSALLDGAAFELAVSEAVAVVTNGSALLDAAGFAEVVAKAVTAATD